MTDLFPETSLPPEAQFALKKLTPEIQRRLPDDKTVKEINLSHLTLTDTGLEKLIPVLKQYKNLEVLLLNNNNLTKLPDDFLIVFKNLTALDLGNNKLTSLPKQPEDIQIQELNLQGNPILHIQPAQYKGKQVNLALTQYQQAASQTNFQQQQANRISGGGWQARG